MKSALTWFQQRMIFFELHLVNKNTGHVHYEWMWMSVLSCKEVTISSEFKPWIQLTVYIILHWLQYFLIVHVSLTNQKFKCFQKNAIWISINILNAYLLYYCCSTLNAPSITKFKPCSILFCNCCWAHTIWFIAEIAWIKEVLGHTFKCSMTNLVWLKIQCFICKDKMLKLCIKIAITHCLPYTSTACKFKYAVCDFCL